MANAVQLASLPNGIIFQTVEVESYGRPTPVLAPAAGLSVFVYAHGTTSPQIPVFQDEGLTQPMNQPLKTSPDGYVPGWVAAGQALDLVASNPGVANPVTLRANAVYAPTAGGLSILPTVPLLYDDFNRSDTVPGTIGSPEVGPAWVLTGSGFSTAQISGHKFISPGGTTYGYMNLPSTPAHYGGRFAVPAPASQSMGFVICNQTGNLDVTKAMLHTIFDATPGDVAIATTIWTSGTPLPVASSALAWGPGYSAVPTDGTVLQADLWVDVVGNTLHAELTVAATGALVAIYDAADPLVGTVAGPMYFCEPTPQINVQGAWAYPAQDQVISGQAQIPGGVNAPIGVRRRLAGFFSRLGVGTSAPTVDLDVIQSGGAAQVGLRVYGPAAQTRLLVESDVNYSAGFRLREAGVDCGEVYTAANYHDVRVEVGGTDRVIYDNAAILGDTAEHHLNGPFYLPGLGSPPPAQANAAVYAGVSAPSNTYGANGDFYFRSDGGAGTTIYQKRAGSWVGVV